jgi:superfamily II DNA or RNA helicase
VTLTSRWVMDAKSLVRVAGASQDRQNVVRNFARGELRALVVSDVAARGLDFPVRPPTPSPL